MARSSVVRHLAKIEDAPQVINWKLHKARTVIGWFSIWQWIVMATAGGEITPIWFRVFDRLLMALSYQPLNENSFRSDREIKRGRS